jgi:ribosome-binding factor A
MAGRRVARLNEQLRRELTELLRREAKDPRVAQVTITAVRTAPDLSFARVFIVPPLDAAAARETLAGLQAAAPFLRRELGARLHVRRAPELHFTPDESLAYARRIEALLHEVAEAPDAPDAPAEPAGDGDHDG